MSIPTASDIVKGADSAFAGGGGSVVDPWGYVRLSSDVSVNTTALSNTTGLLFAAEANTDYEVEVLGFFTSAATTTGMGMALDVPSGVVNGMGLHPISATAPGSFEQSADAAVTGATTGVRASATNIPLQAKWLVNVGGTPGNVQLMHRSEIASSAVVVKAGTVLKYRKATAVGVTGANMVTAVTLTQAAYDALVTAGTVDNNTIYLVKG